MIPTFELFYAPPFIDPFRVYDEAVSEGTIVKETDSKVVVADDAGNKIVFLGDFTPGGTVESFKVKSQGIKVSQFDHLEIDQADLIAALEGLDPAFDVSELIPRDDALIKGSAFSDHLPEFNSDGLIVKGRGGDDFLGGGDGNQTLKGGKGNDTLVGAEEKDKLFGGAGKDLFVFNLESTIVEKAGDLATHRIKDFARKDDDIVLMNVLLQSGPLAKDAFVVGTAATTVDHRVIYDDTTGLMYFDQDGVDGLADPVKFAKVDPGTKLKAKDFLIDFDL
ncbi:hypothetical protein [Bauldia sp.]|uniref:hypothetical protein n=1 Tax=Bauldia sp. TaxID=2575872 RepID=UPI003BA851B6